MSKWLNWKEFEWNKSPAIFHIFHLLRESIKSEGMYRRVTKNFTSFVISLPDESQALVTLGSEFLHQLLINKKQWNEYCFTNYHKIALCHQFILPELCKFDWNFCEFNYSWQSAFYCAAFHLHFLNVKIWEQKGVGWMV